ncbi:hypothetical protein CONLIGDRAFT_705678 [Coniochaeta ligniaria NRRL 30616]|uniref:Uncharacterized protein n=1 Tax=Coniochaeta ligniaria NRRL 30616 TaxID=1408157 RepID=A0A1J7JDH6_9PEZI|nr:hypothetical protein CONLIGDRAFT_705678 [Coniochaeta ligniaria NRRL 30616]
MLDSSPVIENPDSRWTQFQLRALCKGICFYEDAIARIVPMHRKANEWCKSKVLRNLPGTSSSTKPKLERLYAGVGERGFGPLFRKLNNMTLDSAYASRYGSRRGDIWYDASTFRKRFPC